MNELPMKKICAALDGGGANRKATRDCCTDRSPSVHFEPLHLPEEYLSDLLNNIDLSSDQLYLRNIFRRYIREPR